MATDRTRTRPHVWLLVALTAGCSHASLPPPAHLPAPVLPEPSTLGADFMLQQVVRATHGEREVEFSAVVQKKGDKLTMLALTPFGTRALLIEQVGKDMRVEKYVERPMPFSPQFILHDVHRTLAVGDAETDGEHAVRQDSLQIVDTWEAGRLVARRIRGPTTDITIRYEGGHRAGEPAKRITLTNVPYGYTLSIENTAYTPL